MYETESHETYALIDFNYNQANILRFMIIMMIAQHNFDIYTLDIYQREVRYI